MTRQPASPGESEVGLCAHCRHAARQESARGSVFWRCRRADADPTYRRYPPLPVRECPGHEEPASDGAFTRRTPRCIRRSSTRRTSR